MAFLKFSKTTQAYMSKLYLYTSIKEGFKPGTIELHFTLLLVSRKNRSL